MITNATTGACNSDDVGALRRRCWRYPSPLLALSVLGVAYALFYKANYMVTPMTLPMILETFSNLT